MQIIILEEVKSFLLEIGNENESRAYKYIGILSNYGHRLRMPYSKNILPGIFELRVGGKHNIRIIYTFQNKCAVVFYAFMKKTEQISLKEINKIKIKYYNL